MPTRVMAQQPAVNSNNVNGQAYDMQSRGREAARNDDSGSGAEGRTRKRFQKSTSDGSIALRRPEIPVSSANNATESRSNLTSRRQSIRDQKVHLGLVPAEASPSKQRSSTLFNPLNPSTTVTSIPSSIRPVPRSRQSSFTGMSRFDISSVASRDASKADRPTDSSQLLPPVDIGEGKDTKDSGAPKTDKIPLSSSSADISIRKGMDYGFRGGKSLNAGGLEGSDSTVFETRIARSSSFLQRQNSSTRQKNQLPLAADSAPVAPPSTRTRRQSHFPSSKSSTAIGRAPRKSVGPGILTTNTTSASLRSDSIATSIVQDFQGQPTGRKERGMTPVGHTMNLADESGFMTTARNVKSKSMQPPARLPKDYLSMPPFDADQIWTAPFGQIQSPGRSDRSTTTPSSNKRLSVMPGHATGLGARTISPTDARRIKRMSVIPNPPPLPYTPTPQAEVLYSGPTSAAQSPSSLIPRKSTTPSSNRTTPDLNRKSYSSGISISSNTSFNSLRIPQLSSHTRLPTVKNRPENSSIAVAEEVPPVPAIPKAYESPKMEFEMPFYTARKSSLAYDAASLNSASTSDFLSIHSSDKEPQKPDWDFKPRSAVALRDDSQLNIKTTHGANTAHRTLQPLRLPPINLLPLSTPTAAKIAALHDNTGVSQVGSITPPPKRGPLKTPSTPMTASKASFFSRHHQKDEGALKSAQLRSSSSHHALRSETSSYRAPSSSSSSAWAIPESRSSRKISPFISSSLPKSNNDFTSLRDSGLVTNDPISTGSDVKSNRLTGPRAQNPPKPPKTDSASQPPSPLDVETSFSATVRRKLSLTRRRSSSKVQTELDHDGGSPPQPPKHENMPPPRLPASASWSGPWLSSSSPIQKSSFLHSRRKTSNHDSAAKHNRTKTGISTTDENAAQKEASDEHSLQHVVSKELDPSRTVFSRNLTFNGSTAPPKMNGIDVKLDSHDLIAEDEMKKMASRRKDTESAARELDELRRRATPKDRVSPSQALRAACLNIFERGEIIDFDEVFFCGTHNAAKFTGDLEAKSANFGYDDAGGDYNIVLGDHLAYRYEVIDVLGKGSFGQVVRCVDHKTGGLVAIKIIRNKKRFHQQALVEVNILQKLREWDPQNKYSMVNFTQSFYFRGHLCISTELLGMNLYEFIKVHDFKGFSTKLIRRFTKQLLNSLVLLKVHKVIHCDLKPENILLVHPAHSEIKVIDFGSSCLENEKVYTYIQSRFYRSPEVILGMTYGLPIDMWSLGCILAELFTGYPIFPGENEQEQLACIMEVFGPPDKHLIEKSTRKKLFFDSLGKPRLTVSSKGKKRRPSSKTLHQALKCDDEAFLDFVTRCLRWDPDKRLKPEEAIRHEFITGIKPSANRNLRSLPSSSTNVNVSPIKRYHSVHTPASAIRPLPDPPVTSLRTGISTKGRDFLTGSSPIKTAPKRHSTINDLQSNIGIRREANGASSLSSISALPRLGSSRTIGGKPDLAAAAAAAATMKSR